MCWLQVAFNYQNLLNYDATVSGELELLFRVSLMRKKASGGGCRLKETEVHALLSLVRVCAYWETNFKEHQYKMVNNQSGLYDSHILQSSKI